MADTKLTALTELTSLSGDETFYVVDDDDGTPVSKRMTVENLAGGLAGRTEFTTPFAPKASPTFTGTVTLPNDQALAGNPTAPTQTQGNDSTRIATTAFVNAEIAADAAPKTRTVGTGLATSGSIALDMATLHGTIQTITLTGDPTFTTSNKAAGRELTLVLAAGGAGRTITWPSWTPLGAALPTSLASGKTAVLTLTFTSTTEASGLAAYAAEP